MGPYRNPCQQSGNIPRAAIHTTDSQRSFTGFMFVKTPMYTYLKATNYATINARNTNARFDATW